ncbi:MAG: UvrD-helicase domain-containing protein [Lentisphaerae bacterium]|nr:UvrD-helicase domain-containing protein [Lentisphaerota bacterium]
MADILDQLTEAQRAAVTHMEGPLLVVAGAGSGKTRVVTRRIAHLIQRGVWPNQILAMTFTNKAAREMVERVQSLTGQRPPWVGTFHSACARFLRRDIEVLGDGRTGQFTIYDDDDQLSIIKLCMKEAGVDPHELTPSAVRARLSRAKCAGVDPDGLEADPDWQSRQVVGLYRDYERRLRELNAVDFDDLLLLTVRLLQEHPARRDVYHSRFRYILVDEYQDTNHLQYLLMRLLTGPEQNVHATGDPDQSIYSWRGAEYRNIMEFQKDFPKATLIRLEQNYRSTQLILNAANELIRFNTERIEKDLFTENDSGVPTQVVHTATDRDEADWVAQRVQALRLEGVRLRQMAVFYRTNAQSRPLEERLMSAGVPYQLIGGTRFYHRQEVKDVLAHLQLMVNPRDAVALQRVAGCRSTGVGPKTVEAVVRQSADEGVAVLDLLADPAFPTRFRGRCNARLAAFAAWCRGLRDLPRRPVGDAVAAVVEHSGLLPHLAERQGRDPLALDRQENIAAMVDRAREFEHEHPDAALEAFLEEVALVADVDSHDPDSDVLSLMTLHACKGLEFPYVFIVGVEEGYLPHQNVIDYGTAPDIEEERRLLYVGITRARRAVALLHAEDRFLWDRASTRVPSRFLSELPSDEVERIDLVGRRSRRYARW